MEILKPAFYLVISDSNIKRQPGMLSSIFLIGFVDILLDFWVVSLLL